MRCVLILALLPGMCFAGGLDVVNGRFSPGEYGISPQEASEFRTVQDMSEALSKNKNRIFSVADGAYVIGATGAEAVTLAKLAGPFARQLRSLPLGPVAGFAGPLAMEAGIRLPSMNRLLRYANALQKQALPRGAAPGGLSFIRLLFERPTPTGLSVASGECIRIALEDYAFALDNGVDESDLLAAAANITEALEMHKSYIGLVDAEAMALVQESPEGFERMMGLCSSAVESIEAAFSGAKKERAQGAIALG